MGKKIPDPDLTAQILQPTRKTQIVDEIDAVSNIHRYGYGFKTKYLSLLSNLREEACEFLALDHHDPKLCSPPKRRMFRIQMENKNFDASRYLGDLMEAPVDPLYAECMQYRPFWLDVWDKFSDLKKSKSTLETEVVPATLKESAFELVGGFTDEERDMMSTIPIRGFESFSRGRRYGGLFIWSWPILFRCVPLSSTFLWNLVLICPFIFYFLIEKKGVKRSPGN